MLLRQIFDPHLAHYAYLIGCQKTGEALLVDPQRDVDRYLAAARENGLVIRGVAETHIHADFLSGSRELAEDPGVTLYLSAEGGAEWQYRWAAARPDTRHLKHGDTFSVGRIRIETVHTPGHTPEHVCFLVTDLGAGCDQPVALLSGDFLFVGDVGRPDLLESAAGVRDAMTPSARMLGESLRERLRALGDYLQILPAHGAGSACGKSLGAVPTTTLGYERMFNGALRLALADGDAFVKDILQNQPDPPLYFATMKRLNRDGARVTGGVPAAPRLAAADARAMTQRREVRVLDTRTDREEFNRAHLPGAISAPLGTPFFLAAAGSYLVPEDPIVLLVESEAAVPGAVRQLYRIGLDDIRGWISFDDLARAGLLTGSIARVGFAEFDAAAARGEGQIVDVRTTGEFQSEHLAGARSIPYTRLRARLEELSRDRPLFVHCASGRRAGLAASFLRSEGFDAVHVDGMFSDCRGPRER